MQFASLPWYDVAELRAATDSLWAHLAVRLRAEGVPAPSTLDRETHYEDQWKSGQLFLSQACGYDVVLPFADRLQLVATPRYSLDGCDGPRYRSFVVVRERLGATAIVDLRGARCAINTPTSHSGMNMLRALVAPLSANGRFFRDIVVSGAHERSLELLREGAVDVAAIDCVTFGLLARYRPAAVTSLKVIHRTRALPAPPFVTSIDTGQDVVAALRRALALTIAGDRDSSERLGLDGIEQLGLAEYEPIARMQEQASALIGSSQWPSGAEFLTAGVGSPRP